MKNFSIVMNVVLLALVGYLYYVQFSSAKHLNAVLQSKCKDSIHGNKVAYLDLDSLQNNYQYYKKLKTEFERRQTASTAEVVNMQKRYQDRAMQLQQKGSAMNQAEQDAAVKEMNDMQQNLQAKKQALDNELYTYNSKMKEDILTRIQNFLKEYNSDGRFSYIFSYEPGFMFYKDSTLNITQDVIKGLNDLYTKNPK